MSDSPPGSDVLPERPERIPVFGKPLTEILDDIFTWSIKRRTDKARGFVERFVHFFSDEFMVVVETPGNVSTVTGNIDVLGFRRKYQRIQW